MQNVQNSNLLSSANKYCRTQVTWLGIHAWSIHSNISTKFMPIYPQRTTDYLSVSFDISLLKSIWLACAMLQPCLWFGLNLYFYPVSGMSHSWPWGLVSILATVQSRVSDASRFRLKKRKRTYMYITFKVHKIMYTKQINLRKRNDTILSWS